MHVARRRFAHSSLRSCLIFRDDSTGEYHAYDLDLGNLCAFDSAPVEPTGKDPDARHKSAATRIFQSLTHALFKLPFELDSLGRIAELPTPTTALPREKPLPKPRPPTKWEIFAQRKGIQKRKRSNLEWDEATQEWRRRYGYKRVEDQNDVPILDASRGEEPGVVDPFTRSARDKKDRVKKQTQRQLANLKHAAKEGGQGALPATLRLAATLPEHGRGRPTKRKEMLTELKKTSKHVAVSTASMGKHDKLVKGENLKLRTEGRRRAAKQLLSSTVDRRMEKESQGKLVDNIISKNADDIVDIGKAIKGFESSAMEQQAAGRMKRKGANKKGRLEGKSTLPFTKNKKKAMAAVRANERNNMKRGKK
jgi:regulator of ribosome biosynthesis